MPVRIVYINGIKNVRNYLDAQKPRLIKDYGNPTAIRLAVAVAPGILMTPFSSILEASNAGHMNPEPMATRWVRGLLPRTLREVIFAVGINQMSDYCEQAMPASMVSQPAMRNVLGSITAGAIAGYLSHVRIQCISETQL
jgi:hypothetical protein